MTLCSTREEHEKPWVPGDLFSGNFFLPRRNRNKRRSARTMEQRATKGMRGPVMTAAKPISGRRNTMKSGSQDQVEGTFHKIKGKLKQIAGKLGMNPGLEAEGRDEKVAGYVQDKVGQVKKVLGK